MVVLNLFPIWVPVCTTTARRPTGYCRIHYLHHTQYHKSYHMGLGGMNRVPTRTFIFKFCVFSVLPCQTANSPCDNFSDLRMFHIQRKNFAAKSAISLIILNQEI